jgi:selenocysteine-specific elongation factor
VIPLLGVERRGSRLYAPGAGGDIAGREPEAERLEAELAAAGLQGVKVADAKLARALEARGSLVRLGNGVAVSAEAYAKARAALLDECAACGRITLARFRDLLGISRRPAQLLLERFDADGITRRIGDDRVLRRRSGRAARS